MKKLWKKLKYDVALKIRQTGWKIERYKKRFAFWLLRDPSKELRDHISDLFECENDDWMGPNPIELRVLTGHNQTVNLINGKRKLHIILMDEQVIVNCYALIDLNGEKETVHPVKDRIGCHSFELPYNPERLRKLYSAQKAQRDLEQ